MEPSNYEQEPIISGLIVDKYKVNLDIAHLQRVFSRNYNIFLKFFNIDAVERYLTLVENKNGPRKKLEELIKQKHPDNFKQSLTSIPSELLKWLHPLHNIENSWTDVKKSQEKQFNREILSTLYKIFPDGYDPIYNELKTDFSIIKVISRLYYFRIIYQSTVFKLYKHQNPIGYTDKIINVNDRLADYIPVISLVWEKDLFVSDENHQSPTPINIERHLYNKIKEVDSENKLSSESYAFLNNQLIAYQIISSNSLAKISDSCKKAFKAVLKLKRKYRKICESISYADKIRLFESVPFLISSKINNIVKGYLPYILEDYNQNRLSYAITPAVHEELLENYKKFHDLNIDEKSSIFDMNSILGYSKKSNEKFNLFLLRLREYTRKDITFSINIPISDRKDGQLILTASVSINAILNRVNPSNIDFDFAIELNKNRTNAPIFVKVGDQVGLNKSEKKKLEDELYYYQNKLKRDNHSRLIHRGNTFLNVIRNDLEKENVTHIDKRYEIVTRSAMQLVMSSFAVYMDYNSTYDKDGRLEVKSFLATRCLGNYIQEERGVDIKETLNELSSKFNDKLDAWSKSKILRKSSFCYQCIDENQIISRFKQIEPREYFCNELQDHKLNELFNDINTKDRLVFPIICHNRKMGVLYLSSIIENQFKYIDRLRMIDFIHSFSVELFKSKHFGVISKFEDSLSKVLHVPSYTESTFFNEIADEIARLYGAIGAVLAWKTTDAVDRIKVLGRAGKKIKTIFGVGSFISVRNNFVKVALEKKVIISIRNPSKSDNYGKLIYSADIQSCIQVPIKDENNDVLGLLMIFDKYQEDIESQKQFKAHLNFFSTELYQIISHYFLSSGRFEQQRDLVVHDLTQVLKFIDGVRERLHEYKHFLRKDTYQYYTYKYKLDDIENHIVTGRELLDYFAYDIMLTKGEILDDENIYRFTDRLKKLFSIKIDSLDSKSKILAHKTNVFELLKTTYHSSKKKLDNKRITINLQKISIPPLWINYPAVERVFSNIFDNIIKYGSYNSTIKVNSNELISTWKLFISTQGEPLDDYAKNEEDWQKIFNKGSRHPKTMSTKLKGESKGVGLFIAKELLHAYGAQIELYDYSDSEEYADYMFLITFPRFLSMDENPWRK